MATLTKVYTNNYSGRPNSDNSPLSFAYSSFTEDDTNTDVSGVIDSIVLRVPFRTTTSMTPSIKIYFTIVSDGVTYTSDTVNGTINNNGTHWYEVTMPTTSCPPSSVFSSDNFTVKIYVTVGSSKSAYMNEGNSFTITVNYNTTCTYVWAKGENTASKTYPETAMTAANSQNCVASSCETYSSSYAAWRAFDKSTTTNAWATARGLSNAWIQLQMPQPLYNIVVTLTNREDHDTLSNGPITGIIEGSNDGAVYTQIGTITSRDGKTKGGTSTHVCNNGATGYQYVKMTFTDWDKTSDTSKTECCLGDCSITGKLIPSAGGWVKATPYCFTVDNNWVECKAFIHNGTEFA